MERKLTRADFKEKCEDCKYCHELRELVNHDWIRKSVCIYFATESDEYDKWCQVVEKDGLCEMFTEKWGK